MNGRFILALLLALPLLSQTRESRRPADRRIQISAAGASGGSCSAALPDGRSFITGSAEPLGPLATAEYFETDASVTSAAPMLTPRTNHVCAALEDGTVLVAIRERMVRRMPPRSFTLTPIAGLPLVQS